MRKTIILIRAYIAWLFLKGMSEQESRDALALIAQRIQISKGKNPFI